ncbi:MAG: hypothetical protein ACI9OU_000893 [Candidatus Promineifilaceae bacterium]|jgi:hypothetical protein
MSQDASEPESWFLRTSPESTHGELTLDILRQWAESGRILPENEISSDGETWIVASELPDLKMDWVVTLKSGVVHGPLNLLCVPALFRRGVIDQDAVLENRRNDQKVPATSLLRGLSVKAAESEPQPESVATAPVDAPVTLPVNPETNVNVDGPAFDKKLPDDAGDDIENKTREAVTLVPAPRPKSPPPVRPVAALRRPTVPKARVSPLLPSKPVSPVKPTPVAPQASHDAKTQQGESSDTPKEQGRGGTAAKNRKLKVQAGEVKRLREQVTELTSVNSMLQTKVSKDAEKAAETGSASTLSTSVSAETATFMKSIIEARAALAEACKAAAAQKTGQGNVLEQQLSDIATQYELLDSNIGDLVETHQRLAESYQTERAQWEGVERMAQAKKVEDDTDMDQVDASLRQRIALLESALAEYKNKEAKSGFTVGPAKPEKNATESGELDERIAVLEKQNETRLTVLREELQNVIGSLRKENTELNEALSAKPPSAKADTGEWTSKLKTLRAEHLAELDRLKSAHQSELAAREKSTPTSASVGSKDGGADVVGLKKENLNLSQRDAEQSMAIAELKEQVAKLYGEMSTRQKDALSRFKQREEELMVEMSALAAGAPASAPAEPHGDDLRVAELTSELVALQERAKASEAAAAAQAGQIKASKAQAERLAAVEKDLGAKMAAEKKAEQGAKALEAKASEQEKALVDARTAWEVREKEMSAKIALLSAAADKKSDPKPVDDTELKKSLGRIKSLEADLETLSAKHASAQKEAAPSKTAAAVKTPVAATPWFLRLDDGKVFGPVPLTELLEWAVDCRIGPEHQVSLDKKEWKRASEVDDLRMQWKVKLEDGDIFGPVNLFAVSQLIQDGVVVSDPALMHKSSGKSESFSTLIAEEIKHLLGREKELVKALAQKKPAAPPPPKGRKRSPRK